MVKNRVFVFFLAIGLLISAALLSSIPMYTDGALQRLLIKDMESFQVKQDKFPGTFMISYYPSDVDLDSAINAINKIDKSMFTYESVNTAYMQRLKEFNELDKYSKENISSKLGIKMKVNFANYSTDPRTLVRDNFKQGDSQVNSFSKLESFTGFNEHIKILDGRFPVKTSDGVYEVLVSDLALNKLNVTLGKVYILGDPRKFGFGSIKVKPVGTYDILELKDPYWAYVKPISLEESMILDEATMLNDLIKKGPTQVKKATWFYAIDYHSITINKLDDFVRNIQNINSGLHDIDKEIVVEVPVLSILGQYVDKKQQIINMMWSLNVPVIVILCLYMFMISGLIIERERNEIALLSSRGAEKYQVVFGYFVEGVFLSIMAIIIGPFLGYFICKLLGASSGFLEFVDRKPLDTSINLVSYLYVLISIFVFMTTLIIPAYKANKTNIVGYKQRIGRRSGQPLWEKFFFDFLLLAIAGYGYYNFIQRQNIIKNTGISALDMSIDPLFFIVPVLFIIGVGLLFLRIYPFIIKLIYFMGKKFWPPSLYTALIQVGRSTRSYDFLMIFLMLTLSVGIFSANSARTINKNAEEKIMYTNGAHIVIDNTWVAKNPSLGGAVAIPVVSPKESDTIQNNKILYYEPSFNPYTNLNGVEHATKVFTNDKVGMGINGKKFEGINIMAIDPYDFGQVAWFRDGLMPHHINEYLNLLSGEPSACLISKSISKNCNINVGDNIVADWNENKGVIFNVYGIIDYWPTFNPNELANGQAGKSFKEPMLIVSNLSYVQSNIGVEPYKVWLKMKPNATSKIVYDSLKVNKLIPDKLSDSKQEIIKLKNDPFELAINGSLTMGFIICGIICFMGFVLYWVLSLKARSLQFGVLRAMGLTSLQLKIMIMWEQLLTSGIAMLLGVIIGFVTSNVFVPFFQLTFSGNSQVPPFRVISYASDMVKVYSFIGFTVVLGLGVLIYMLSKIKISNVIKLGED
ncbi:MAG: FtsX-like permease family protein [Clostridiaceae bacterium]|nr:FtsX-like permease family protein [Clostridiaceae bacterium]